MLLFIDMESSTAIAERLGEAGFLDFLNRFVADVTGPIVAQRGEIHKYVGDELIVTWALAAGLRDGRCIRACFDALAQLDALTDEYTLPGAASLGQNLIGVVEPFAVAHQNDCLVSLRFIEREKIRRLTQRAGERAATLAHDRRIEVLQKEIEGTVVDGERREDIAPAREREQREPVAR